MQEEIDVTQETGSHTEPGQEVADAFEAFGLERPEQESPGEQTEEVTEEAPATEQPSKTIKVKHNKQEIEVDVSDEKLPEYVQKALALDKERDRRTEAEKNLDRAAKLNGFESHADFVANLDRIEQERARAKEQQFADLEKSLYDELVDAGVDEDRARQYIESHPLLQEAREAKAERERAQQQQQQMTAADQQRSKWQELYNAYPDLAETSRAFEQGQTPDWYNDEMAQLVEQGYHPLHAYKLTNMDKIQSQTKKATEQKLLKEQRLGLHAKVVTDPGGEQEPEVDPHVADAFAAFGMNPKLASKYVKKAR